MSPKRLLALTEEIYDAAAGGTPWAAVGSGLKALVGARSASLMAGDFLAGRAEILCHADIPEEAAVAYRRHYRHVDLWTNRAAAALARGAAVGQAPRVLVSGEVFVPDAEFLRSEFYCDFGRRYGLRYVVGTVVQLGEAGAMPIGLHRPHGMECFGAAERRLLDAVLPHLRRALQLRHRLNGAAGAGAAPLGTAALDALSLGVLVVDAGLRVLVANAVAEAMTSGAGAALRLRRAAAARYGAASAATVAEAGHRGDRAALGELVRATALGGHAGGALRLRDAASTPSLTALVMPLPRRLSTSPGAGLGRVENRALILLRDAAAPPAAPRIELLRGVFGLTRAEAEVARALVGGATKRAVADARGLRETTVRSQVRAVLEKTGAANLRDLERLLAGLRDM
jgi:DNA-binding CsgD family transcriptional regulator